MRNGIGQEEVREAKTSSSAIMFFDILESPMKETPSFIYRPGSSIVDFETIAHLHVYL